MTTDDAINLSIPVFFLLFLLLERMIGGGRPFPAIRFWTLFGIIGFLTAGAISVLVPSLVAPALTWAHLLDLSRWGFWGVLPTVVLTTSLTYGRIRYSTRSAYRT